SDAATAKPTHACDPARYASVLRQAGGAAGEMLWQFPVPGHIARGERDDLVKAWEKLHDDHAAEQMLRQLILALRMWRPSVVITDGEETSANGHLPDALVAEAVREAVRKAADAGVFPEQL